MGARRRVWERHTSAVVERLKQGKAGAQGKDVGVRVENHLGELALDSGGRAAVMMVFVVVVRRGGRVRRTRRSD